MIKKRLIRLLSHAKKYVVYQVVLQWIALLARVFMIYAAASLLEGAAAGRPDPDMVISCAFVIVVAIGVRYLLDREISRMSYLASADVKRVLREKIYSKLLRLGASYRESAATSEVVQMSAEGVEQLETYFGKYLPQFFYSLLAPLTLFALLSFLNLKASAVLLVCVPLIPVSIVVVQKIAKRLLRKYWGIYTELGDSFLENLQGLTTLKIYKADGRKAEEMDAEAQRFRKVTMKVLTMQLNSTSVMDIVAYGGAAVGMAVAVTEYAGGRLGMAGTLTIILLASEFFIPLRQLGSYFHIAMNGMAASDRIFDLLDLPEPEDGGAVLDDGPIDIVLSGVRFSYDAGTEVLRGVDLEMPARSFTSLVGLSGCGKSTVAAILAGRTKEYSGSITVQGRELRTISEKSLMEHITLVSGGSYIFKGTVRDNLLMGKPDADDETLCAALEKVNLLAFLETQQGLDTMLQERGGNLSGGQCQRLALARALLHDTPVYIFDEATSNIDAESEALIMRAVRELARTKTVLLISHRLANVVESDRVCMLRDGVICESGTHRRLMAKNGPYCEMYRYQKAMESYAGVEAVRADAAAAEERHDQPSAPKKEPPRRSGWKIMRKLIGLVKPLVPVMLLAILLGVAGYLCAISLTILAGSGVLHALLQALGADMALVEGLPGLPLNDLLVPLIVFALARGFLHYGEQYCNHFIAFKLLAVVRHKVFAALRRLAPAKLEGKDRGDLIAVLTSDIELLEVFYAHTISPVAIAVLVSGVMAAFIGVQYIPAAAFALVGYIAVGVLIPVWNGARSAAAGMKYRSSFGDLNSFVLDSLRGLDETIQYGRGEARLQEMTERSRGLRRLQRKLNVFERSQRAVTNLAIELFSFGTLFFLLSVYAKELVDFPRMMLAVFAVMGSFGPVAALSNLSNSLSQTLASGERVLRLLEEEPQVEEVVGMKPILFHGARADNVSFSYGAETILQDLSVDLPSERIIGIHGVSGSGKSTLLKLFMRFWDVSSGSITISGRNIRRINTDDLRDMESYVTQETYLFRDSIANNIAVGRLDATREEIVEAARKAALDDFVGTLPKGYDTEVGELGETLSAGERQRIGVARAFLHDAPLMLLDEPTSNLDPLNEGIILKSLSESADTKTVVLVSHRRSTLNIADCVVEMEPVRFS